MKPFDFQEWLKVWREARLGADFETKLLRRLADECPQDYMNLSEFVKANYPHLLT